MAQEHILLKCHDLNMGPDIAYFYSTFQVCAPSKIRSYNLLLLTENRVSLHLKLYTIQHCIFSVDRLIKDNSVAIKKIKTIR